MNRQVTILDEYMEVLYWYIYSHCTHMNFIVPVIVLTIGFSWVLILFTWAELIQIWEVLGNWVRANADIFNVLGSNTQLILASFLTILFQVLIFAATFKRSLYGSTLWSEPTRYKWRWMIVSYFFTIILVYAENLIFQLN